MIREKRQKDKREGEHAVSLSKLFKGEMQDVERSIEKPSWAGKERRSPEKEKNVKGREGRTEENE